MADPFVGQMMIASWNYAPKGWALCNGALLDIRAYADLYRVIGLTYGGDGVNSFALPDLRGRLAIGIDRRRKPGEIGGATTQTLTPAQLPEHGHPVIANVADGVASPTVTSRLAKSIGAPFYGPPDQLVAMSPDAVTGAGGGQPHDNRQPFLVLNVFIATAGAIPPGS
jgi:microcystin-dependent protein